MGALEVVMEEIFHTKDLSTLSFAIQGVGKVGGAMLEILYGKAKRIVISDQHPTRLTQMSERYPNAIVSTPEAILFEDVDILIPCALGGVFSSESAARVGARAIVGSANNQLENDLAGDLLHARGIFYAPDYIVNAGGLISVVHEFEQNGDKEALDKKVKGIKTELYRVIKESKEQKQATHRIANTIARKKINQLFAEGGMDGK
jgi:glutamate dehydrogenase/leucine dehydrogenase